MSAEQVSPDGNQVPEEASQAPQVRSLKELMDRVTGKGLPLRSESDAGLLDPVPFPFFALVGQTEMKLALLLSLINPGTGGVLLIGPRGTGKTTAVRSLIDLLPETPRSRCYYGCLPEDIETGGIDAVCPDCARKYALGESLTVMDTVRMIELPLNARLDDVVGGLDERAAIHDRTRLRRGILSLADHNILYIDEVNLLSDEVVDAILDAAGQGRYTIRRGPLTATYRSRFILIGSMNPEEGRLRPQIMDRFGLRVVVKGLSGETDSDDRLEAYRRVSAYQANPRTMSNEYSLETEQARQEIRKARELLPQVVLTEPAAKAGLAWVEALKIDSLRAEITLFEAGRAYAARDGRLEVSPEDLRTVAPLALRMRRSTFMETFFQQQDQEDRELKAVWSQDA